MELYELHLYELLKARLGEKEAVEVVRQLERRVDKHFIDPKFIIANKQDIAMLKEDIINTRIIILKWMMIIFLTLALGVLGLFITIN